MAVKTKAGLSCGKAAPLHVVITRVNAMIAGFMGNSLWFRCNLADEFFPCGPFSLRSKQVGAARDRATQTREELRVGLDPVQQSRQRRGVADRKIARIVAAEQADRAIDARGQHGNA